jgi:hypothetical protein
MRKIGFEFPVFRSVSELAHALIHDIAHYAQKFGRVARTPNGEMNWVPHTSGLRVGFLVLPFPVFIRQVR